jgi:hypothetical protein
MNGFVNRQLQLGSKQPIHKYKLCNRCEEMRPPEGGIELSPTKWSCAGCWTNRVTKRNLLNAETKADRAVEAQVHAND